MVSRIDIFDVCGTFKKKAVPVGVCSVHRRLNDNAVGHLAAAAAAAAV